MHWLELAVTTSLESREAVAEKLLELGAAGVSLEEPWDWEQARRDGLGDVFPEKALARPDAVTIRGYVPVSFFNEESRVELERFLAMLPEFGLAPAWLACRVVDDADWENAWKDYWYSTPVGMRLLIVPAWEEKTVPTGRIPLLLDPGPAFGTGTHESTRLCLELLEEWLRPGESVLDLGCGSGILALAAVLLGAGRVFGVDRDETAVRVSKDNAALNKLESVSFFTADLTGEGILERLPVVDLVLANLTADLLVDLAGRLKRLLNPGGRIIASGIIRERAENVARAFAKAGCRLVEKRSAGEWAALLLEMK